ncbi:hypothetical protein RUM43_013055 [Polyplax serrata]|uniref:Calpain catalytic domain-containing protein n=1 Tax=Polyplax serrata TaxID=468196 RepID=A0AAN8S768_POLSC
MSTRAGSNLKSNVFNEGNESLYDPYYGFPVREGLTNVPWPEWSDADLNSEYWEEPKLKSTSPGAKGSNQTLSSLNYFEDEYPPKLPAGIREYVSTWKRPHEVFLKTNLTVFDEENVQFQLSVPSPVAECGFFTMFNEFLPILQYYALSDGFGVELETPTYVSTTQGEPWTPWHHVYSLCKAGKGQVHKPSYNSYGKYVVRLNYFGTWRKFIVDDTIPCDKYGLCMLPVTQVPGELWPILLAKGMLKVISLTSSTNDFPFISLITGWVNGTITTANKTHDQIWRRISILVPRFEQPSDDSEGKPDSISFKASSKKESIKEPTQQTPQPFEKFCVLLASLGGFNSEEFNLGTVNVLVTMSRDEPLVKASKREATKIWKRLRWVYWASKKGIWTDERLLPPYRRLQYLTFAEKVAEYLAPDPLQETTLFAVTEKESSIEQFGESDNTIDAKEWSDFYKFCEYLMGMSVLLKPSSCTFKLKMTCLGGNPHKIESVTPGTSKTTSKPAENQNFYFYSTQLTPTLNNPLVMFCESSSGIFICFSLWVCPLEKKTLTGYLDGNQPEILKVGQATLILEEWDWRTLRQGQIVGFVKTVGNSSLLLHLKPGRHVFKIWLSSDSPYSLDAFSNTDMHIHKGPKIRFLLNSEPERVLSYIANLSNAFIAVTLKFGKADLPAALRDFYSTLKPGNDSSLYYSFKLDIFIELFLNCIMQALKNQISNTDELKIMLGALRSLFYNPGIRCNLPPGEPSSLYNGAKKAVKKIVVVIPERTLSEILSYPWTAEEIQQIILIQKVFRGYRTRLLLKYQTPARKEFKPYTERLKKICDTIFVPPKREVEVGKIIRMVVINEPQLLTTFKFYKDFSNSIDVNEFTGRVAGVEPFAWVPLARFIIACHGPELVPCAFYFSCNLEQYVVVGVDNDTNEEIFSLANTISPHNYKANTRGYTIFIFGWNEANMKTVNWRLEMVRTKHFPVIHLCNTMLNMGCSPYPMPTLEVNEIKNFYVPNQRSRMCRCTIKIQKKTLLTLRLTASYPEVEFVLTISPDKKYYTLDSEDSSGRIPVMAECYSINGAATVSSVVLEKAQDSGWWDDSDDESTRYYLDAYILNDSWPLTRQEWGVIEPIRVNSDSWKENCVTPLKKTGSESRKKLTRMSKRSLTERTVENPFWLLQVLSDSSESDAAEAMVVEEDKSYTDSVKAMKLSWEEKSPGRKKKGSEVRLKFLKEMFAEQKLREERSEGEVDLGEDKFNENGKDEFKQLLNKMVSFSYLTSDKCPERYSKSPRVLPWMPTMELVEKYKRVCQQNSSSNSSIDCNAFDRKTVAEDEEEHRREFLTMCNHYRQIMVNHWAEEQRLSSQLIEQALKQRTKAIQRMMG